MRETTGFSIRKYRVLPEDLDEDIRAFSDRPPEGDENGMFCWRFMSIKGNRCSRGSILRITVYGSNV